MGSDPGWAGLALALPSHGLLLDAGSSTLDLPPTNLMPKLAVITKRLRYNFASIVLVLRRSIMLYSAGNRHGSACCWPESHSRLSTRSRDT